MQVCNTNNKYSKLL